MARTGRPRVDLVLSDEEREQLVRWARRRKSSQALALRSRIVLECATGDANTVVAERLGISRPTVGKWRSRFLEHRLDGLVDDPRPGRPATVTAEQVEDVVVATLESTPENATRWSRSKMAERTGLSGSTIGRIWKAFGLKPHRTDGFKLSNDPLFVEKVYDIVGLYLDPPESAVVLSVDEKSQVQALSRSQPAFPMMPGMPPIPHALHADILLVDQPGRTALRRGHPRPPATLRSPQRPGPREGPTQLDQSMEREPEALHLDQDRRPDPRIPRTTITTN